MATGSSRDQKGDAASPYPKRLHKRALQAEFFCERRDISIEFHQCLTDYVNANALKVRTSQCFNCARGLENRVSFAKGQL